MAIIDTALQEAWRVALCALGAFTSPWPPRYRRPSIVVKIWVAPKRGTHVPSRCSGRTFGTISAHHLLTVLCLQFDSFKRDLARALNLDVHDKIDENVLLAKIRKTPIGEIDVICHDRNAGSSFPCVFVHVHVMSQMLHTVTAWSLEWMSSTRLSTFQTRRTSKLWLKSCKQRSRLTVLLAQLRLCILMLCCRP